MRMSHVIAMSGLLLSLGRTDARSQAAGDLPRLFAPGTISTGDMELNAAFTPDGNTLFFTKRTPKLGFWVILETHRSSSGRWTEPRVASFSGRDSDFDPFVSPDGSKLFFSSNRELQGHQRRDFNIWVVDRVRGGWSAPRALPPNVNTDAEEFYPTVSAAGVLYFSSNREGGAGSIDIYRAMPANDGYADPQNLGQQINSRFSDGDPYIAPDESYLLFVSYGRPEGQGDGDLYLSEKKDGAWTTARNLGPSVNSRALDFCPLVSPDGKTLFFTSERDARRKSGDVWTYREFVSAIRSPGNGLGDIYSIPLKALLPGR